MFFDFKKKEHTCTLHCFLFLKNLHFWKFCWKTPCFSLKKYVAPPGSPLFVSSFFDSCLFCGRNDTDIGRGSSVAASRLIPFLVSSSFLAFIGFSSFFFRQCFFIFFIAFFVPFCTSSFLPLCCFICLFFLTFFFPLFSRLSLFKLSSLDLLLLFSFSLNPSFFFHFLFFNLFLNSFVKTCHSFCLSLVPFFAFVFFCLFSPVCSLFFVVYMLFVNIVFSESSSFESVSFPSFFDSLFWSLCFDPFWFFWEIIIFVSVLSSLFLVLFLVHHFLFPPTKLFSLFHSVRLFVSLRTKH